MKGIFNKANLNFKNILLTGNYILVFDDLWCIHQFNSLTHQSETNVKGKNQTVDSYLIAGAVKHMC